MSVQTFKRLFFEAVLDLLWRQWSSLGIPGQIPVAKSETIVDPEALLVFSAGFARYDQRLYDLMLDWLQFHASQINVQRLKALYAKAEWKDDASLGYVAAVLAETDARWKKPAADYRHGNVKAPVALFRNQFDEPEYLIRQSDPLALSCGFLRTHRVNTGKVPAMLPGNAATLLLRMRGLLGISARAETILILLSAGSCKVQDIVKKSGFQWKSIQDVLEELAAANLVGTISGNARGKQYFLKQPEKFLHFFEIRKPVFAAWSDIYDSIGLLWNTCQNPALAEVSAETCQYEFQSLYGKNIQPKLFDCELPGFQMQTWNPSEFLKALRKL